MATIIPPAPAPAPAEGKPPPVMSQKEVVSVVYSEMGLGSLSEATRKYLSCVDNCHRRYPGGRKEDKPVMPKTLKGRKQRPTLSGDGRKRRLMRWKIQNQNLNTCLKSCKAKWYNAVIDLIGEANFQMNKDVLSHILTMLVKPRAKKKSAKKKTPTASAKKGRRKTRRKKGTRRKRKTRKGKTRKRKRRK